MFLDTLKFKAKNRKYSDLPALNDVFGALYEKTQKKTGKKSQKKIVKKNWNYYCKLK